MSLQQGSSLQPKSSDSSKLCYAEHSDFESHSIQLIVSIPRALSVISLVHIGPWAEQGTNS